MIGKVALLLFVVAAVSSNPATKPHKQYIERTATVGKNGHVFVPPSFNKPGPQSPRAPVEELVLVENCGMAPLAPPEGKIVGGEEATPHEYPWQAAVYIDNKYFCGGSVISDEWVMTAGHCLYEATSVRVILGAHNLTQNEPTQLELSSTDIFTHEDYKPNVIQNDIAMIHLPSVITFNDYIQPVCLPSPPDLGAGVEVWPTGWGKTKDGPLVGISDVLMETQDATNEDSVCADYYSNLVYTEKNICIDATDGHGTCNGDSGGPLNYKVTTGTEVRGITSYGSSAGCQSGAPDAFTRVTHFLDWIQANTGVTRSLPSINKMKFRKI